ncbi:hypothetical protein LZ906_010620 [Paraclostridium ghonii]|uniref:hypothetical protein n=1 Tax=Paraclostridium ghonii TaxID=29358 RepID=UPI00352577FC
MCDQKTAIQSMINTLNLIEDLSYIVGNEDYFFVPISITTDDGLVSKILISNSKKDTLIINNDVIIYKDKAINLNNIVKVKILTQNIPCGKFKSLLLKKLENLVAFDNNSYRFNSFSNSNNFNSFNNFNSNIQDYIMENTDNIKTFNFNNPLKADHKLNTKITSDNVLNESTDLDVTKENLLKDFDLGISKVDFVSYIEKLNSKLISNIETEKKLVLSNKSSETLVSKPIDIEPINVLTDLAIKQCNISVNPTPTKAVSKIIENTVDCLSDINTCNLKNTLSDINAETQIIQTKTVEVLELTPLNNFVDKSSLDGKALMLDPTGERYVGIVLDDGTFEPLKINLKKLNVIEENANNLIGNIDIKSQLNSVVSDISTSYTNVLQNINVNYNNNLAEHNNQKIIPLESTINLQKESIKNITNNPENVKVVCKDNLETINSLKHIDYCNIEHISDIKYDKSINNIDIKKNKQYVVGDINFDKKVSNVLSNIALYNIDHESKSSEKIDGTIDYVGNGIVIVNNNDSNITVYPITKISVIN